MRREKEGGQAGKGEEEKLRPISRMGGRRKDGLGKVSRKIAQPSFALLTPQEKNVNAQEEEDQGKKGKGEGTKTCSHEQKGRRTLPLTFEKETPSSFFCARGKNPPFKY